MVRSLLSLISSFFPCKRQLSVRVNKMPGRTVRAGVRARARDRCKGISCLRQGERYIAFYQNSNTGSYNANVRLFSECESHRTVKPFCFRLSRGNS
ncbi:MAG: hypothetical protein EHJ95_07135 [Methanobacteriota archaeon]|nr:MAG: hypothetical protein EHJ95_07135 [Euryarchaeota archaeon]